MKTRRYTAFIFSLLYLFTSPLFAGGVQPDAVVALDGNGDYTSIHDAIMKAPYHPDGPPWVILVRPGIYEERVYVQRERGYIRLVGEDRRASLPPETAGQA